jgi:hypothetical protein
MAAEFWRTTTEFFDTAWSMAVFCPGRVPAQDHNPWPTSGRVAPGKWGRRQVGGEAPMANRAADGAAPLACRGDGRRLGLAWRRTTSSSAPEPVAATDCKVGGVSACHGDGSGELGARNGQAGEVARIDGGGWTAPSCVL